MAGKNQNMPLFEAYFKIADLDGDGRISEAEALGFLKGSGLPEKVLAQIWSSCDRRHRGFLGREGFYSSLRLVTLSQSNNVTFETIVAALSNSANIPPPKIDLSAISSQPVGSVTHPPQPVPTSVSGPTLSNASPTKAYAVKLLENTLDMINAVNELQQPAASSDHSSPLWPKMDCMEPTEYILAKLQDIGNTLAKEDVERYQHLAANELQQPAASSDHSSPLWPEMDCMEQTEYYLAKMQDIANTLAKKDMEKYGHLAEIASRFPIGDANELEVLYKSRRDNRLNEISERARADKREDEAKKEKKHKRIARIVEIEPSSPTKELEMRLADRSNIPD